MGEGTFRSVTNIKTFMLSIVHGTIGIVIIYSTSNVEANLNYCYYYISIKLYMIIEISSKPSQCLNTGQRKKFPRILVGSGTIYMKSRSDVLPLVSVCKGVPLEEVHWHILINLIVI